MKISTSIPYEYSYDNNSSNNHLIIHMDPDTKLIEYQIEMIRRNIIDYIIEVTPLLKNNSFSLYYDITDRITLHQFLKNKILTKNEVIDIIIKILRSLSDSKEYLLYENSFILNKEMIYIDIESLKLYMIYVPVKNTSDALMMFKKLLKDLINTSISLDSGVEDIFLQKIINYLNRQDFNLQKFYLFLDNLRNSNINHDYNLESWVHNEQEIQSQFNHVFDKEIHTEDSRINEDTINHKKKKREKKIKLQYKHSFSRIKNDVLRIKSRYFRIGIGILSQILIAIVLFLGKDVINNLNEDITVTYIGIGIVITAIDVILFKKLFN